LAGTAHCWELLGKGLTLLVKKAKKKRAKKKGRTPIRMQKRIGGERSASRVKFGGRGTVREWPLPEGGGGESWGRKGKGE